MRVTIINRHVGDTLGGSEIQCDLLARGLVERGHTVTYVAPVKQPIDVATPYGLRPVSRPSEIIGAVLESQPEVVYWRYNLNHFRAVAKGLGRAGIPMVFAVSHINDVTPWLWHRPSKGIFGKLRQLVRRRWNRGGFRDVQTLTTLNSELLTLSPVASAYYVPNAMSTEAEPFHWPRPYVAWIANIKQAKRPELFVDAARALASRGIDALMVGHIQSRSFEWLTDSDRVPPNFYYLGPRTPTEVNGLLAASRLHVHTCCPEGFGNVFIQAWLQGRPSVSLEFDPCGYIAEQGLGAVAGDDVNTFIQQVVDWATQPEHADVVGERARAFARETFSVGAMVERVEEILVSLLSVESNVRGP